MAVVSFVHTAFKADGSGDPESGALTSAYVRGTETRYTTYTDSGLTTPAANPAVANSLGIVGPLYFSDADDVTFRVTTANGATRLLEIDYMDGVWMPAFIGDGQMSQTEDTATGNGTTTAFAIEDFVASSVYDVIVFLDGRYQAAARGSYTVSTDGTDTTVTFLTAPANGVKVDCRGFTVKGLRGDSEALGDVSGSSVTASGGGATRTLATWMAQLEDSVIVVADYTALKALTAGRYLMAAVMDSNRGGVFIWTSGDQSALVTSDPYEGLYVPPSSTTSGASGCWSRDTYDDGGYANWFGAVADWNNGAQTGTDNAPFINACWDHFDTCKIRKGSYAVGSVLTIDVIGGELIGEGQDDTNLYFTSTSGHCVQVLQRYCEVKGISILAATARAASAYAATKGGLVIGGSGAGLLIANHVEDVTVFYQPGDGIIVQGEANNCIFRHVVSGYNSGHGWYADNGTRAGITTGQPGINALENCQSVENGGAGFWGMPTSSVNLYRWLFRQFECYDNGWNDPTYASGGGMTAGITGGAQVYLGGESHEYIDCAFGDERSAQTTTAVGTTRLAKAAAGGSINFALGKNFAAVNTRHIQTSYMLTTGDNLEGIHTRGAYSSHAMTTAYIIGSGCTGVDLDLSDTTNVTNPVDSLSTGIIKVGGVRGLIASHGIAAYFRQDTVATFTIVSGAVSATADFMILTGEGDAADNLTLIVNAGAGNYLPAGAKVTIMTDPAKAYDITVKHGTGNIYTKTAADVALSPGEAMTFRQYGNNLYEC